MSESSCFDPSRRRWLQRGSLTLTAALGTAAGASWLWPARSAFAADYRALVCIYLFGGNDSFNMLVPRSASAYATYSAARPARRSAGLSGVKVSVLTPCGTTAMPSGSMPPSTSRSRDQRARRAA